MPQMPRTLVVPAYVGLEPGRLAIQGRRSPCEAWCSGCPLSVRSVVRIPPFEPQACRGPANPTAHRPARRQFQLHARPLEIRRILNGQLEAGRTRELADRMRTAGLALRAPPPGLTHVSRVSAT